MKRCKYCDSICPDFSDICDCCAFIEEETNNADELLDLLRKKQIMEKDEDES